LGERRESNKQSRYAFLPERNVFSIFQI